MAAPSYLRQIAERGGAEPFRTTLAPRRSLFRPIPPYAVPLLEVETRVLGPTDATPPSPIATSGPEPQPSMARPGRAGIAQPEVLAPAEQGMRGDPVRREAPTAEPAPAAARAGPTRPRDADRDPAPARASTPSPDARASGLIPLHLSTGSSATAARAVPSAPRDPYPALVPEQPASQTLRPLSPSGDPHGRALSDPGVARTGSGEHIAAREERILLTPTANSGPRRNSGPPNTGTAPASARGGVHIGSLEVHVTAPPSTTAPPLPPPATQTTMLRGRAAVPLARGFPGFGLVQS
jgi:hypothetical protein